MLIIAGYLAAVNLAALILFALDKRRAIRGGWRIPEKTLMTVCSLFGAAGGLIGMRLFRHKTRKPLFYLGVPALLAVQAALLVLIFLRFLR